jgi:hypothetical protein
MEDLVKCVIQDFGKTNGSNANQLKHSFSREELMWNWGDVPPCPVSDTIKLLKYGGDVPAAREQLVRHAELFDAVTEHPLFEAIQQKMVEGRTSTRPLVAQYFEDMEAEHEQQQRLMHSHDTAFMKIIGNGLSQRHGNSHDIQTAIAHRFLLVDIVRLIDQGKISSALRELTDAQTCEDCRNPAYPADKWVDGRCIRSAKEAEKCNMSDHHHPTITQTGKEEEEEQEEEGKRKEKRGKLLEIMCTVLDGIAFAMDTTSFVMFNRTCKDASTWHPDTPLLFDLVDSFRVERRYPLATRLALSHQQQQQQRQQQLDKDKDHSLAIRHIPFMAVSFQHSTIMYNHYKKLNLISEVHEFVVNHRRKKLVEQINAWDQKDQGGSCGDVICLFLQHSKTPFHKTLLNFITEVGGRDRCGSGFNEETERLLLCLACETNNYEAVHFFMFQMGFAPSVSGDFEGTSPLHAAARAKNLRIMKLLCTSGDIGADGHKEPMSPDSQVIMDKEGRSVLDVAIQGGHVLGVQWLVEECCWDLDHSQNKYLSWSLRWSNILIDSLKLCPEERRGEMSVLLKHYGVV